MADVVKEILRIVSSSLQVPTIIILILLILLTLLMLGSFVAEIFTERKSLKLNIPDLVDQLQGKSTAEMKDAVEKSSLLTRQKEACRELINRVTYPDDTREALARQLIADEEIRYGKIVKITDLTARVAPMFGLMGTLIPLGPGLIALGQGDTSTLSGSLLIAFDTTVAGLISGAISYVISGIRKNWYEQYMIGLETIMETILDVQSTEREKIQKEHKGEDEKGKTDAKATPSKPGAKPAKPGQPAGAARPGQPGRPGQPAGAAKPGQPGQPGQHAGAARPGQPGQRPAAPQQPQGRPAPQGGQPGAARPAGQPGQQPRPQQGTVYPQHTMQQQPGMVQPAAGVTPAQMSRATQAQPARPHNSKTDQTMVQRTFQEEVRAAEQALREAELNLPGEGARQPLHTPNAGGDGTL